MNRNSKRWMTPSATKSPVVTLPADTRRRLALVARSLAPEQMREIAIEARTNRRPRGRGSALPFLGDPMKNDELCCDSCGKPFLDTENGSYVSSEACFCGKCAGIRPFYDNPILCAAAKRYEAESATLREQIATAALHGASEREMRNILVAQRHPDNAPDPGTLRKQAFHAILERMVDFSDR